ncbi:hypothetical protein C0Q70_12000 [Pomacea canaliculata]|uniref:ABC-type glutathione-S-conjugate transporter n=1 Tax=Pomacea canaliculata TaxID=400727 RepID=A0A2T7P0A4_POMCA|nr:hypothetical protein C0Q70_12000 [Pomacea canaliculata]
MEGFEQFCGGEFWNDTLIIDNTWPQFTDCFMHTALIWVPCGFLWLLLPVYISSVHEHATNVSNPMTCVSMTRLFCCIALVLLSFVTLILRTDGKASSRSLAAFLGDGIDIATYVVMGVLSQYERIKGAQPRAVAFFFWLLSSLCAVVPFYTMIVQKTYEDDLLSFVVLTLSLVLRILGLVLTGFNDTQGGSEYKRVGPMPCPETTCSFPSYLFYWWMTSLVIKGYKKDLEENELWELPPQDQTTTQVPKFEKMWKEEQRRCALINSKLLIPGADKLDLTSVEPVHNGVADMNGATSQATEKTSLLAKQTPGGGYSTNLTPPEGKDRKYPSLLRVIVRLYGWPFMVSFVQKVIADLIFLSTPLLLGVLMSLLSERLPGKEWQAYLVSLVIFLCIPVKSLVFAHSMFRSSRIGIQIKSTFVSAVYNKALTMNNAARNAATVGEIVNLMSVDAQRIQDLFNIFFFAMTTPIQIIVSIVLLYLTIGPSIIVGVILLACLIPLNSYVASKQRTLQNNCLKFKDTRIRMFNEILNGIKVLKLYAWEPSFREKIRSVRAKEVGILLKLAFLNTIMSLSWDMAPYLVTLVTFATYVLWDRNSYLDPGKAFVSLSLFNLLRPPLTLISSMIMYTIQAQVSIKRINRFLVSDDLDPNAVNRDDSAAPHILKSQQKANLSPEWNIYWDRNSSPSLTNINLEVEDGMLVAVVGPVGCGKSSLISAILGEMEVLKGTVTTRGTNGLRPQQAWIQNATLRDNVLFGKPYDRSKYNHVLEACELERDLTILSAGDMTEIGEKGINLSGGQKQRVSLARAVYSERDVYLFDDPLSAVDSHVGKAIFKKVIGPTGLLQGKTRILVTHGVHWLPMVDEIIVMQDGKISERGSYEALLSHNGPFAQFLKTFLTEVAEESTDDGDNDPQVREILERIREKVENVTSDGASSGEELYDVRRRRRRSTLRSDVDDRQHSRKMSRRELDESTAISIVPNKDAEIAGSVIGKLTTVEALETGKVKREVFGVYGRAAGMLAMFTAFFSFCIFQAFSVAANFWLNNWTGIRTF